MQDIVNIYKFIKDEKIPSICFIFFKPKLKKKIVILTPI